MSDGTRLAGYTLLELAGRGGMGSVWRALDPAGRVVALKRPGAEADVRRALLEARAVARLRHPAIVPIHAVGEDEDGRPFLVFEWVAGGTLEERLRAGGPLPLEEARALGLALASALAHAHANGVLHRDVKPANVLFSAEGAPRLADFGLARDLEAGARLSRTGAALGSPEYWAPEQALGQRERVDARTDLYGLGATLHAALTGRPPFEGETLVELVTQTVSVPAAPPSRLRPEVSPQLDAVVLRCLEKSPDARFGSALELARALEAARPGRARGRRWPLALGAALLLCGGGALAARARPGAGDAPVDLAGEAAERRAAADAAAARDPAAWGRAVEAAERAGAPLDPGTRAAQARALAPVAGARLDAEGPLDEPLLAAARALLRADLPADEDTALRWHLARALRWRGRHAEALEAATPGLHAGPQGPALALERGLLLAHGDDAGALEALRADLLRGPDWLREVAALTRDLSGGGDVAGLRARAERLATSRPDDPYVLRLLAIVRGGARDLAGAERALAAARALTPREPELLLHEARLRAGAGDVEGCVAALDRLDEATEGRLLEPGLQAARLLLFERFDGAAAEARLERLLRRRPHAQPLLVLAGLARRDQGDLEGALARWREAEAVAPDRLEAAVAGLPYDLGPRVLSALGRPVAEPGIVGPVTVDGPRRRRAVAAVARGVAGEPDAASPAWRALEEAYLGAAAGEGWGRTAARLEEAARAAPDDPSVALARAQLLVLRDHDGPAREALADARRLAARRAAAGDGASPPAWRARAARLEAELHLRGGRRGEALARFEATASVWPGELDGAVAAAEARALRGDADGATAAARSAVERAPDDHAAQVALVAALALSAPTQALERANALWAATGHLDARALTLRWEAALEHTIAGGLFTNPAQVSRDLDLAITWYHDARVASAGLGPDLAFLAYAAALPGRTGERVRSRALERAQTGGAARAELLLASALEEERSLPSALAAVEAALAQDPWVPVRSHVLLLALARGWSQAPARIQAAVDAARAGASRALAPAIEAARAELAERAPGEAAARPAWADEAAPGRRAPTPLPGGVEPAAAPGEYRHRSGLALVWVPPLRFVMGRADGDADERPLREVAVPGFFLGLHEVTWAEYLEFCRATRRAPPPRRLRLDGLDVEAPLDHPVTRVSWHDAAAFCAWAGLRLPTEAEWERAARGDHLGQHPWGDAPADAERLNCADASATWAWPAEVLRAGAVKAAWDDGFPLTAPARSLPRGAAPCGALHLAGNVSEWVQDRYAPTSEGAPTDGSAREADGEEARVFRGGSYYCHLRLVGSSYRARSAPDQRYPELGFRVARSAGPEERRR